MARAVRLIVEVDGVRLSLRAREWSPWVSLVFRVGAQEWHGICRLCLLSLEPHLRLYLSPIHQHPLRPVYPFTHPSSLARTLVDAMGLFPTLGWAEDATGLNAGHLDEEAFLEQAYYILDEQDQIQEKEVVLGEIIGTSVEVLEGLDDETEIISSVKGLSPKQKVTLK